MKKYPRHPRTSTLVELVPKLLPSLPRIMNPSFPAEILIIKFLDRRSVINLDEAQVTTKLKIVTDQGQIVEHLTLMIDEIPVCRRREKLWKLIKSATITISGPSKVQERGNNRLISCWIVGCVFPTTQIKVHSFNDHLPRIFDERIVITDDVNKTRMRGLMQVTTWVLGKPRNLDDLLKFVNMQHLLTKLDESEYQSVHIN